MFELHQRLADDSFPVQEDDLVMLRLVNDARFPWVLIVPKVPGVTELHELIQDDHQRVMSIAQVLGREMKKAFDADKINSAAIGNLVPQLHIHVVARTTSDAAWPGPIWGVGEMEPLTAEERGQRVDMIAGWDALSTSV